VDVPHYTFWGDEKLLAGMVVADGIDPDSLLAAAMAGDSAIIDATGPDTITGVRLCRGNSMGRWLAEGGYDAIAESLFTGLHCDRLLLEYDDERSGGFAPLRFVPEDKTVVLSLVSSKTPRLESRDALLARIEEASAVVPIERLALSPQCGFSSSGGGPLSADDQWRKLELVASAAAEVWGWSGVHVPVVGSGQRPPPVAARRAHVRGTTSTRAERNSAMITAVLTAGADRGVDRVAEIAVRFVTGLVGGPPDHLLTPAHPRAADVLIESDMVVVASPVSAGPGQPAAPGARVLPARPEADGAGRIRTDRRQLAGRRRHRRVTDETAAAGGGRGLCWPRSPGDRPAECARARDSRVLPVLAARRPRARAAREGDHDIGARRPGRGGRGAGSGR
jgi:hypothetical protein